MKKVFVASLFVALGSIAQAAIITATCTPNPAPYLGQSGGGTEVCSFALPGGATVNSITAQYVFDFQFDQFSGLTKEADFSFDGPGGVDFAGTATAGNRPVASGPIAVGAGDFGLFTGGSFNVLDSYTGASAAVTGGTFSKQFELDYTPAEIPEPSTFALIGLGLSGLAFFRRK